MGVIPWATWTWKLAVHPVLSSHYRYWQYKQASDRFLERQGFLKVTGAACAVGAALYFCLLPLRSHPVNLSWWQLYRTTTGDLTKILGLEEGEIVPWEDAFRIQREILSRVRSANNRAEIKEQRRLMDDLKKEIDSFPELPDLPPFPKDSTMLHVITPHRREQKVAQ
jgi:hypothetical protein